MKKMKFYAIVAITVLSVALLCACSYKGENADTELLEAVQEEPEVTEEPTEEVEAVEEVQEDPAEETSADEEIAIDEKKESALQVMDSLMLSMLENDYVYEPENPEFFWLALFYEICNYGYLREGSGMIEEGIAKVYYRVVQDYATGLIED